MEKSNGRIAWLDVAKGILILFLLLSHSSAPNIYVCDSSLRFSNNVLFRIKIHFFHKGHIPYFCY